MTRKSNTSRHLIVLGLTLGAAALLRSDDGTATVSGNGTEDPFGYVPVLVANGELAMTVDKSFGIRAKSLSQYSQGVYLEGRRQSHPNRELFSQGRWMKKVLVDRKPLGSVSTWRQSLDMKTGTVTCRLDYPQGLTLEGETFIPFSENTIAIKMRLVSSADHPLRVTLGVDYFAPVHERIVGNWSTNGTDRVWAFRSYGYRVLNGKITVRGADATQMLNPGECLERTFFILFSDTMRHHPGRTNTYAALKTANDRAWADYWAESSVTLPDASLQRAWIMANYHLKINATPWSFPVGILKSHWGGLFFGFDEMYMHQGLLSSAHLATARLEPDYRYATLKTALLRNRYGNNAQFTKYGARYFWEALEDGQSEGTVAGEWMDHIFHMATIAKCAWQQWLYGRDRAYLESKTYPILYECARFYRNNWVYKDSNGDMYIGKCCDLERLGPARDRPFMTTCGAIYTLRAAAEASALLQTNMVDAADFRHVANALERSLPQRDGRYITCLNEPQESMATLAGFFPFPIFAPNNTLQRNAVRHFIEKGRASGNMYPTGSKICPWYAGTMSAASSYMEDRHEPVRWLREAASAAGLFGEYWEINEPGATYHPWFATAAGNCLYALNQMLVTDRGSDTFIAFTIPEDWRDLAFRLPAQSGVMVDCRIEAGRLVRFSVQHREGASPASFVFRPDVLEGVDTSAFGLRILSRQPDRVKVAVDGLSR